MSKTGAKPVVRFLGRTVQVLDILSNRTISIAVLILAILTYFSVKPTQVIEWFTQTITATTLYVFGGSFGIVVLVISVWLFLLRGKKHEKANPLNGVEQSESGIRISSDLPYGSKNMPHIENPDFWGREQFLRGLRSRFASGESRVQTLHGLSGIGKTQIAVQYVFLHRSEYDLIWWIQAKEPETLASDFTRLAGPLGFVDKQFESWDAVFSAVYQALEERKHWLLVFDDAQPSENLLRFLPHSVSGDILITSVNPDWNEVATPILVEEWARDESVDYLKKRLKNENKQDCCELAKTLYDFPLALAQASSFIKISGGSITAYLKRFRDSSKELLGKGHGSLTYNNTVATTWAATSRKRCKKAPGTMRSSHAAGSVSVAASDPSMRACSCFQAS